MLTDIVNVSISLDTTGVQQAGFGVPIFIGAHRWFPERFRSYNNIQAVSEDIPTDYAAQHLVVRDDHSPLCTLPSLHRVFQEERPTRCCRR